MSGVWHRLRIRRVIAGLLFAVSCGVALTTALYFIPKLRLLMVYGVGRHSICSFADTVAAFDTLTEKHDIHVEMQGEISVTERDGNLQLWNTPMGPFWCPVRHNLIDLITEQAWNIYSRGAVRVRRGDVVFDCGANVGVFTREALDAGASLVVAIEPSPENVECLRRNFAKEVESGAVLIQPVGVWNEKTILKFYRGSNSAIDSFVFQWDSAPLEIPVTTIDALVDELQLPRVDFIKLDIEGAESAAVRGAFRTITRDRPRIAMDAESGDARGLIEETLAVRPDYEPVCGPCEDLINRVRPTTLYFR